MIAQWLSILSAVSLLLALAIYCRKHHVRVKPRQVRAISFGLVAAVSFVLLLAALTVWVRSYFVVDRWRWGNMTATYGVESWPGVVELWRTHTAIFAQGDEPTFLHERFPSQPLLRNPPTPPLVRVHGWYEAIDLPQYDRRQRTLFVPCWFFVAVSVPVPALWTVLYLRSRHRNRRCAAGFCPTCGYNLTANTSAVCPECGNPTSADAKR